MARSYFLSQQAAEKSLKATILYKEGKIPKIHPIRVLIKKLNLNGDDIKQKAYLLDKFYIPSRYPDALPGSLKGNLPTGKDAKEALEAAEKFYNLALEITKIAPAEV